MRMIVFGGSVFGSPLFRGTTVVISLASAVHAVHCNPGIISQMIMVVSMLFSITPI